MEIPPITVTVTVTLTVTIIYTVICIRKNEYIAHSRSHERRQSI